MAKGRTTVWTDPNGYEHTRTSQTKHYTHIVIVERDLKLMFHHLMDEVYAIELRVVALRDLFDDPQPPHLKFPGRLHRYEVSRRARSYASCLWPDRSYFEQRAFDRNRPYYWLPDWQKAESWAMSAESAVQGMERDAVLRRECADKAARSGLEMDYLTVAWSQSADNAEKARRREEKNLAAYDTLRVYEVNAPQD